MAKGYDVAIRWEVASLYVTYMKEPLNFIVAVDKTEALLLREPLNFSFHF